MGRKRIYLFGGVWGNMYAEYLKAKSPNIYELLKKNNQLDSFLQSYQNAYAAKARMMEAELAAERQVDDYLYEKNRLDFHLQMYKIQAEVREKLRQQMFDE